METLNWNVVNNYLNRILENIFKNIDIKLLDGYSKRKIIFDYLCDNISYDYQLLEKIKLHNENSNYNLKRNPYLEIESVLKENKGICNAIAQVYKLLLEKVGIYSMCVICDDGTKVKHQLNLVYDEYNNTFSFDDITSVIVNRGDLNSYFDYDMEDAINHNQGCKPILDNNAWVYLPTNYVYSLVGRQDYKYLKFNMENPKSLKIPENIVSIKKQNKKL